MRVLVVTNLTPDAGAPQRGRWVFDQIDEIRTTGIEVDLFGFPPGRGEYVPATRRLLGRYNWWAPRPLAMLYHRLGLAERDDDHALAAGTAD